MPFKSNEAHGSSSVYVIIDQDLQGLVILSECACPKHHTRGRAVCCILYPMAIPKPQPLGRGLDVKTYLTKLRAVKECRYPQGRTKQPHRHVIQLSVTQKHYYLTVSTQLFVTPTAHDHPAHQSCKGQSHRTPDLPSVFL